MNSDGASPRKGRQPGVGPQRDREATAAVLADAALRVLAKKGSLRGFSLTEVADEAQVDRALVYQYFGDRQALIRAALRRGVGERYAHFDNEPSPKPLKARWGGYLRTMLQQAEPMRLITMLHLDKDPKVRLMPIKDRTLPAIAADQTAGYLDDDVTPVGFLLTLTSIGYGYSLFRDGFARELGIAAEELDSQVEHVVERLLEALGPSGAEPTTTAPPTSSA